MAREINFLVPFGVLGLDLRTNKIDNPESSAMNPIELAVRDLEVDSIFEYCIAMGLLTEADIHESIITYMSTNEIRKGLIVEIDGKRYSLTAEVSVGNQN